MRRLKYLITGTGRSGTVFLARFMTTLGIQCSHEGVFNIGGIEEAKEILITNKIKNSDCSLYEISKNEKVKDWLIPDLVSADSSYMAAPFLNDEILKDTKIIHLVRSPLAVLSSWVLDQNFFSENPDKSYEIYRSFIFKHMPIINEEKTEIEKACRFIIDWNILVEKCPQEKILVKIEDYPFENLLKLTNKKNNNLLSNQKINSWKKTNKRLKLEDIPEGKTKEDFLIHIKKYKYLPLFI